MPNRPSFIGGYLAIALILCFSALSSSGEEVTHLRVPPGGLVTKFQRTEFANRLKQFFEALDKKIPTVKPSEREYVEKELKRLQTRGKPPSDLDGLIRWRRESDEFLECREYKTWRVKEGIESLLCSLDGIISERYRHLAATNAALEAELSEWAQFSHNILDTDIFEHIDALNLGTRWTERDIIIGTHGSFDERVSGCRSVIGAAISDYIFGSYFNDQIRQKSDESANRFTTESAKQIGTKKCSPDNSNQELKK